MSTETDSSRHVSCAQLTRKPKAATQFKTRASCALPTTNCVSASKAVRSESNSRLRPYYQRTENVTTRKTAQSCGRTSTVNEHYSKKTKHSNPSPLDTRSS